jgi:hypothetical protein
MLVLSLTKDEVVEKVKTDFTDKKDYGDGDILLNHHSPSESVGHDN